MTAHGGTNPNASCSRLVSRMVISSALAPARLSLAPCSPPSRTLRAASRWPAAILDRSCAQRLRELRPGRRNGSQPNRETPDQPRDWLSLPTPNSEEAIYASFAGINVGHWPGAPDAGQHQQQRLCALVDVELQVAALSFRIIGAQIRRGSGGLS